MKITFASKLFRYNCIDGYIYKYMKLYKKVSKRKGILQKIGKIKLNKLGFKIGLEIPLGILDESTIIYHENVVINSYAKIGKNVKFHGNNCIGNTGLDGNAPIIGDNVDIGYGAVIIGDVRIPNGCIIGANSTVTHSFDEENITIAGSPARRIK